GVDRVGDVGVELGAAIGVADGAVLVELVTARVAVTGTEVVLAAAGAAAVGELAARHGDEAALGSFDDLPVTHDEGIFGRGCAEGLQPLVVFLDQFDADFGDDHSGSSFKSVASSQATPEHMEREPTTGRPGRGVTRRPIFWRRATNIGTHRACHAHRVAAIAT